MISRIEQTNETQWPVEVIVDDQGEYYVFDVEISRPRWGDWEVLEVRCRAASYESGIFQMPITTNDPKCHQTLADLMHARLDEVESVEMGKLIDAIERHLEGRIQVRL